MTIKLNGENDTINISIQEPTYISYYNDSDALLLLSTNNITLSNEELDMQIGTTESSKNLNILGNVNISFGSKYLINGTELSLNDVNGTLSLDKGGTGTSLTSIDDLKEFLGISTYKITDISPAYFNLTTTGIDDINGEAYMKPMTFTIYGKNFDKNIRIKIVDNFGTLHSYINTIYYDSPVKIRADTKYIKVSELNQVDKYPYKIKIYHKDDITKHAFSGDIYKDEAIPSWSQTYDNVIYEAGFSFNFSVTDSDDPNTITYSYSLADGDFLPEWLNLDIETGILSGDPLTSYSGSSRETYQLTINANSGTIELSPHPVEFHILAAPTWSTPSEVELSENTFTLEAVSDADSILGTPTNITYSIETNSDADNISLSGNTITVTDLELLGESGKNITVKATDAYGYSSNKTINIIKNIVSTVYSWGSPSNSMLGYSYSSVSNNTSTPYPIQYFIDLGITIIKVSSSSTHTLFLTNNGKVYGIGYNANGQLANGSTTNEFTNPVICSDIQNYYIVDITTAYFASFFLTSGNIIYRSGSNNFGILGGSTSTIYNNAVEYSYFTGKNIIKMFCGGGYHIMFLSSDNKLYGCGYNGYGQLGIGNTTNTTPEEVSFFNNINIKDVSVGSTHTLVLTTDGKVYGFGYDGNGELGRGNTNASGYSEPGLATILSSYNVSYISASYERSLFITTDNKVYSVGFNHRGQLGNGNFENKTQLQHISFFDTINITKITSGNYHSLFLSEDGNVYSVGENSSGQLGIGTKTSDSPTGIPTIQNVALSVPANDIFAYQYQSYALIY